MTTQRDLTAIITTKYHIGQVVTFLHRNKDTGAVIKQYVAEIVKFYPYHVDCIVNGHHESFTYWNMMMLTANGKR